MKTQVEYLFHTLRVRALILIYLMVQFCISHCSFPHLAWREDPPAPSSSRHPSGTCCICTEPRRALSGLEWRIRPQTDPPDIVQPGWEMRDISVWRLTSLETSSRQFTGCDLTFSFSCWVRAVAVSAVEVGGGDRLTSLWSYWGSCFMFQSIRLAAGR